MEAEECLRCGTPYQPGQTVCFTCGAPIGETRTSTHPVPAVRIPRAEEPEHAEASAVATGIAEPPADRLPAPRASRKLPLLPVIIAVALALVFGGAAYALWTLTASPPVPKSVTYRDPQHRFQFERPALWTATTGSNGVHLTDSGGTNTADITLSAATSGDTAAQAADTLAKQLGLAQSSVKQFAGVDWEERDGQVTGSDGAVRQVDIYVTIHNGEVYTIAFSSPLASYTSINNLVFQPLLSSFSFA